MSSFLAGLGGIGRGLSAVAQEQSALNRSLQLLEKQQSFTASESKKARKARKELQQEQRDFQKKENSLTRDQSKYLALMEAFFKNEQLSQQDKKFMQDYIQSQQELGMKEQEIDIRQQTLDLQVKRDAASRVRQEVESETEKSRRKLIEQQTAKLGREQNIIQSQTFANNQKIFLGPLIAERDKLVELNITKPSSDRTARIKEISKIINQSLGAITKEQNRILKEGGSESEEFRATSTFIAAGPQEWQEFLDSLPDDEARSRAANVARKINPKKLKQNRASIINELSKEAIPSMLETSKEAVIGGLFDLNSYLSKKLGLSVDELKKIIPLSKIRKIINAKPTRFNEQLINRVPQQENFLPLSDPAVGQVPTRSFFNDIVKPSVSGFINQQLQGTDLINQLNPFPLTPEGFKPYPPGGFERQQQDIDDLFSGNINLRIGPREGEVQGLLPSVNILGR